MSEPTKTEKPCSQKTAGMLYAQLEYYREYAPYMMNMSPSQYATTQEAKNADAALASYREETGEKPTY